MDQATQVNFPIGNRNEDRRIKRHNTAGDLFFPNRSTMQLSNSWTQLKPLPQSPRPKTLNLSAETFTRSKLSDSTSSRLCPSCEIPVGSISRERTPPFSCNSSIILNSGMSYKPPPYIPPKPKQYSLEEDSCRIGSKHCQCCEVESASRKYMKEFSTTSEGLSWRRMHMSRAKLKATATTSELLSGFAMIAMVELQINEKTNVPEWLFVIFAVCTTVLVAVHIFALMISTYILPNIEAIAKLDICEIVAESPHERLKGLIELAWAFSTILGLFLFLVEVGIVCWVKFWDYSFTAAIAATVIVVPVLIIFVLFAVHYYHSVVVYKCDASISDIEKLEDMKKQLDAAGNIKIV